MRFSVKMIVFYRFIFLIQSMNKIDLFVFKCYYDIHIIVVHLLKQYLNLFFYKLMLIH